MDDDDDDSSGNLLLRLGNRQRQGPRSRREAVQGQSHTLSVPYVFKVGSRRGEVDTQWTGRFQGDMAEFTFPSLRPSGKPDKEYGPHWCVRQTVSPEARRRRAHGQRPPLEAIPTLDSESDEDPEDAWRVASTKKTKKKNKAAAAAAGLAPRAPEPQPDPAEVRRQAQMAAGERFLRDRVVQFDSRQCEDPPVAPSEVESVAAYHHLRNDPFRKIRRAAVSLRSLDEERRLELRASPIARDRRRPPDDIGPPTDTSVDATTRDVLNTVHRMRMLSLRRGDASYVHPRQRSLPLLEPAAAAFAAAEAEAFAAAEAEAFAAAEAEAAAAKARAQAQAQADADADATDLFDDHPAAGADEEPAPPPQDKHDFFRRFRQGRHTDAYQQACKEGQLVPEPLTLNQRDLNLAHYSLGPERGLALARNLSTMHGLTKLDLCDNRLKPRTAAALLNAVPEDAKLVLLRLARNPLGREGALALADALERLRDLVHLDLSACALSDANACAVVEELRRCKDLERLNLSNNHLGDRAGVAVGELLERFDCGVTWACVSHNELREAPARAIAEALEVNTTLRAFDMAHNAIGDAGAQAIARALVHNHQLTELDASSCALGPETCVVLEHTVAANDSMRCLRLDGNPLKFAGARAAMRMALRRPAALELSVAQCDMSGVGGPPAGLIDLDRAADESPLELDLSTPYGHAVAALLYQRADATPGAEIGDVVLRMGRSVTRYTLQRDADTGRLIDVGAGAAWVVPTSGTLSLAFSEPRREPDVDWAMSAARLERAVALVRCPRHSEADQQTVLAAVAKDAHFLAAQVGELVRRLGFAPGCDNGASYLTPAQVLQCALPRVLDRHRLPALIADFTNTPADHLALVDALGAAVYSFSPENPSGAYRLDLGDFSQRRIAHTIWHVDEGVAQRAQRDSGRDDTSQAGNWRGFRNARYNHMPVVVDEELFAALPRAGILEFDYVSTDRPPPGAQPAAPDALAALLRQVNAPALRSGDAARMRRVLLELPAAVVAADVFLSAQQLLRVVRLIPERFAHERASVVVALFGRLIELEQMPLVLDVLHGKAAREVCDRLGVLNVVNPMDPTGVVFRLRLRVRDERILAQALMQLGKAEPGRHVERVRGVHGSHDALALQKKATSKSGRMPAKGTVCFRYTDAPEAGAHALPEARAELLPKFLLGSLPLRPGVVAGHGLEECSGYSSGSSDDGGSGSEDGGSDAGSEDGGSDAGDSDDD